MILLFTIGEFCCYGERDYGGVCSIFKKEKKSADCFKRPSNAQRWDGGQESKSVNQSGRLRTKLYRESRNLSEARFEYRSKRAKDETRTVIIKQIKTFFGSEWKMWVKTKIETILTRLYFDETSRSRSLLLNVVRINSIKNLQKVRLTKTTWKTSLKSQFKWRPKSNYVPIHQLLNYLL